MYCDLLPLSFVHPLADYLHASILFLTITFVRPFTSSSEAVVTSYNLSVGGINLAPFEISDKFIVSWRWQNLQPLSKQDLLERLSVQNQRRTIEELTRNYMNENYTVNKTEN